MKKVLFLVLFLVVFSSTIVFADLNENLDPFIPANVIDLQSNPVKYIVEERIVSRWSEIVDTNGDGISDYMYIYGEIERRYITVDIITDEIVFISDWINIGSRLIDKIKLESA